MIGKRLTNPLHQEWAELADRVGASPFVHPGWVMAWAESRGVEVELIHIRRGDALVAALPVVRAPEGIVSPTDWHTPLFEAIALDEGALGELAALIVARRHRYVRLGFLDADGPTHRVFSGTLQQAGYRLRRRTALHSPYMRLTGSWEDFLARWPSKKRSDLRRRRRRLDEQGVVSLEVHDGTRNLDDLLTEGFDVEASGWKGSGSTSITAEGTEGLYREAAAWAASQGKLRLGFLRLDGQAIAFDYSFEARSTHYLLKTGFRPDYSAYSPGKLLRAFMIEHAFADRIETYDFVGDNDKWKLEWTDTTRPTVILDAYSRGVLGWISQTANFIERWGRWMGRRAHRVFR